MEDRKFYYLYLLILIPMITLIIGLSAAFYYAERKIVIEHLEAAENLRLMFKKSVFEEEFHSIVSDLLILASHQQIGFFTNDSSDTDYDALTKEFFVFSKHKKKYDQTRLLDRNGQELIRVDYGDGNPKIVPRDQLQSKTSRYYFKDTMALRKGEVFVSPLDLNIENGEIEVPFRPTIRFGVPIFSHSNEKIGAVILNYYSNIFFSQIERVPFEITASGFDILLNKESFYLKGMDKESEWGFMIEERKNRNFINDFPEVGEAINNNFSGQIITDDGLFSYITVYPLAEGLKSSSGSSEAFGESIRILNAKEYYWKMISYIPRDKIDSKISMLRDSLYIFNLFFFVFIVIAGRLLVLSAARRRQAEETIKKLAHFDHLTELPNRKTLYDRLNMSIAISKRNKTLFFVFFIDLDGFKAVNDKFGHDAGDKLISEVAVRLKGLVRESDTVARLGGDEFVILLNSAHNAKDAGTIADKILESLSREFSNSTDSYSITASIGIAVYPSDGTGVSELLNSADSAMYKAKENGKNTYCFYQKQ